MEPLVFVEPPEGSEPAVISVLRPGRVRPRYHLGAVVDGRLGWREACNLDADHVSQIAATPAQIRLAALPEQLCRRCFG